MKLLFIVLYFVSQIAKSSSQFAQSNNYFAIPISHGESMAIVNAINSQRFQNSEKVPMPIGSNKVKYNFEVAKMIYDWSGRKEGTLGTYGITNLRGCWRAESPNNVGSPMCYEIVYRPIFNEFPNWEYGMFGTCSKGQFPISTVLKGSNSNFDYRRCNDTVSTYNYGTCEVPVSSDSLSFLPSLLDSDLLEVSCLMINGPLPGKSRNRKKDRSFICLLKKGPGSIPKNGDRPYSIV
jgi:hypothetical protein